MANNNGTLIVAPIRPQSDLDRFPSAFANEIKGGFHQVVDITARDAIPTERRQEGMWVQVIADGKVYKLNGGVDNVNWIEVQLGNVAHNHNTDYYTKTEIDTIILDVAPKVHNHDDLYYTKTQNDTLLDGKANVDHTHPDGHASNLVGTKVLDETNIGNNKVIKYNAAEDKLEYGIVIGGDGGGDAADVTYTNDEEPTLLNVKLALDKLLYKPIAISSFTNDIGVVEVGSVITDINLSWSLSKTPLTQTLDNTIGDIPVGTTTKSLSGLNITSNITFKLTVTDAKTTTVGQTGISFRSKMYWGTSPFNTLDDIQLLGLSNNAFITSIDRSFILNGAGEYIYFAYPASFGEPNVVVNGLLNTAWTKVQRDCVNSSGFTESYNIYRSDTKQNGSGINIVIS